MRQTTLKYAGECRRCGATLEAGHEAMHERGLGVWCAGCAPTDPEELRALREERAERKAAKREAWAEARENRAAALQARNAQYRGDWAFATQPGHIPERTRANRRDQRAFEEMRAAGNHRAKAARLRAGVRVAGDAQRKREELNDAAKALLLSKDWLKKGARVYAAPFPNPMTVLRLNAKTVTVQSDSGYKHRAPYYDITPALMED